jgi:peptide/nickel transport system substrate-binding protein
MRGVGSARTLWLAVAVAALAGMLGLLAKPEASTAVDPEPATLRAAFGSFPDYLDPALSYTGEGWTAMYDTYVPLLTYRHANGRAGSEVIPGLATDLPKVTNGGRTYTLFLRQGLRYSDGTAVKASHFEYAVKRMFKLRSGGSPFYTVIAGARRFQRTEKGGIGGIVTDDKTGKIVIHLVRPRSTFTSLLALVFAAPVPPSTPMREQSLNPPPATGPYAITEVDEFFGGWSYSRNPAWESSNGRLLPQLPGGHVDRIEVEVTRNPRAAVKAVIGGEVDWMQNPPSADWFAKTRRRLGGDRFRVEPILSTEYFWMNTQKPPFNDVRVREAANHAVSAAALARIYGGQLRPTHQILPPHMPGFKRFNLFPYDLAKARRLVAAADPADREITVWTDTESSNRRAGEYFRAQLQKIGFRARLEVLNPFSYLEAIGNRATSNLDAGWGNWFADYAHPDDFFRPLLFDSSIRRSFNSNFAQLSAPALDSKIEALSRKPLSPATERRYASLDRGYMKRAPWVPFGTRLHSTFVSRRVALDEVAWSPLFGADLTSFRLK